MCLCNKCIQNIWSLFALAVTLWSENNQIFKHQNMDKKIFYKGYAGRNLYYLMIVYTFASILSIVGDILDAWRGTPHGTLPWQAPVLSLITCLMYFYTVRDRSNPKPRWLVNLVTGLVIVEGTYFFYDIFGSLIWSMFA